MNRIRTKVKINFLRPYTVNPKLNPFVTPFFIQSHSLKFLRDQSDKTIIYVEPIVYKRQNYINIE